VPASEETGGAAVWLDSTLHLPHTLLCVFPTFRGGNFSLSDYIIELGCLSLLLSLGLVAPHIIFSTLYFQPPLSNTLLHHWVIATTNIRNVIFNLLAAYSCFADFGCNNIVDLECS